MCVLCRALSSTFFGTGFLAVVLLGQRFRLRFAASVFFAQFCVFVYRFSFQASWLRCTMALCSLRSFVDVEAGTRVGPKEVCFSCTAAFTVLITCGRHRIVWFIWFGATVLCFWIARLGPLRALLCGWERALLCFVLFSLDLGCFISFCSDGAMHLVPCVAMPFGAFCIKTVWSANSTLFRRASALCKTSGVPGVTLTVLGTVKSGLVMYSPSY